MACDFMSLATLKHSLNSQDGVVFVLTRVGALPPLSSYSCEMSPPSQCYHVHGPARRTTRTTCLSGTGERPASERPTGSLLVPTLPSALFSSARVRRLMNKQQPPTPFPLIFSASARAHMLRTQVHTFRNTYEYIHVRPFVALLEYSTGACKKLSISGMFECTKLRSYVL
jgi:hypothetical protein